MTDTGPLYDPAAWLAKGRDHVRNARAGKFLDRNDQRIKFPCDISSWPDTWVAAELATYDLETDREIDIDQVVDAENPITVKPIGDVAALLDRAEKTEGAARVAALEAAWRACFAPELADAIEAADAAIVTALPKAPKKKSELEVAWAEWAKTASPKNAFEGTWPSKWKDAQRRMRVFYQRPRSPLHAAAAVAFATQDALPYTSIASQKFWQALSWFIAEQCDVRQLDALAQIEARIAKFHGHKKSVATDALRAWPRPALSEKLRARIAKLPTAKPAKAAKLSLASPEERSVAADALLQAGDPRGELITVQEAIAKQPTPALLKRQTQLLKKHAKTWCPPMIDRDTCVFRGGVPVAGHLSPRSDSELESFIGSKALATFETLVIDGTNAMGAIEDETIAAVVRSLPTVRYVITTDGAAEALARGEPTAIEHLAIDSRRVFKIVGPGLPKLRRLDVDAMKHGSKWSAAELGCTSPKDWNAAWREKLAATVTLCTLAKHLNRLSASADTQWELVVKHSAITATPLVGSTADSLVATLELVPDWKGVTMLRVPENFVDAIAKLARKAKVTVKPSAAIEIAALGFSLEMA